MIARQTLCICADDYGLDAGIHAAVLDLFERGRLHATSCLVQRDAWAQGAPLLRALPPRAIDVGLHLDLTPPSRAGGREPPLAWVVLLAYLRRLEPRRLSASIRDQLSRFEDDMGRAPAFVDGHCHVHQLPVVRELLTEELDRRYARARPWLRGTAPAPGERSAKARLIHWLGGRSLARLAKAHGLPLSRALLGVHGFDGQAVGYVRQLEHWLRVARDGDVLMCHPSAGAQLADPIHAARLLEYRVLLQHELPATVRLAPLSHLLRPPLPPDFPRTHPRDWT